MKLGSLETFSSLFPAYIFLLAISTSCQSTSQEEESPTIPSMRMGTVFESPVEFEAGENPTSIVTGDWDKDGRIDLMLLNPRRQSGVSTENDGTLTQFIYNVSLSGKFPLSSSSLVPNTAVWRQHLVAMDFNADNRTDLVIVATNLDQINFLQNDSGSFIEKASINVGDVPVHLETGDWDSDNDTDLSVVNRAANSVSILSNINGEFTLNPNPLQVGSTPLKSVSGDWDNDSDTDLAVLASADRNIEIWLNNLGSFTRANNQPGKTGNSPKELIGGDWNCDGQQDLATTNYADNTLSLYYGNSSSPAYFSDPVTIPTGSGPLALDTADFNSDNLTDFVVAHRFSFSTLNVSRLTGDIGLILSKNIQTNGKVNYSDVELFASTLEKDGSPPADIRIIDIDNDTKLDVLLSLPVHKKLAVLSGKTYYGSLNCN